MFPSILRLIEAAEHGLRKCFPAAAKITINYENCFELDQRESRWKIRIEFPSKAVEAIEASEPDLFDAVTAAIRAGQKGISKRGILAASDN